MDSLRPSLYFDSWRLFFDGATIAPGILFLVIINISVGLLLFKNIRKQAAEINAGQGDIASPIQKLPPN